MDLWLLLVLGLFGIGCVWYERWEEAVEKRTKHNNRDYAIRQSE